MVESARSHGVRSRHRARAVGATVAMTIFCLVASAAAAAGGVRLGGLWLLNEGAGQVAHDSSGNRHHGTLGSTPSADDNDPRWIPGPVRGVGALRFDGNDFVSVADSPTLESKRITVGALVRATGSPGSYRYVASKGVFLCDAASYGLYSGPNGGLIFYISNGSSFTLSPDAGATVWDGRWHVVAGTFDGAAVRLYVDGVEVGAGSASTLVTRYGSPDDDRFYIGDYGGGSCGAAPGFLGDIGAVGVLSDVVKWHP